MNDMLVFGRILNMVSQVNTNAYLIGECFFLPFFNNRFGPPMMPVDVEVLVDIRDVESTEKKLREMDPALRWHVVGLEEESIKTYLQRSQPLIAFSGAIRLKNVMPEYIFGFEETKNHLEDGCLEWNDQVDKELALSESIKWQDMFTGLKSTLVEAKLKELEFDWEKLEQNMKKTERGGKVTQISLSIDGEGVKGEILQWHRQANKDMEMIVIPPKSKLPSGDPWIASDEEFREWIIDQFLTKYPKTKKDPYVHSIIDMQKESDQKPTHLGWKVYQHSIFAALCLNTKGFSISDRKISRLAIMWHDLGKCANIWTPGAHGAAGAKLWKRYKPDWVTESEEKRISLLIKAHDYMGLMDRAIKDENFKGGISPQQIISFIEDQLNEDVYYGLQLISRIYLADISSVATLRWLISLTGLLDKMVITEYENRIKQIAL
ncbi:hypothetical protein SAMN04488688_114120 [Paenibacillus sp. cl141a]|uniref:hypothetical protein n=1 Tax=Paenibacillus TaxID=44249 RepID=UPI0008C11AF3|nr:hypothetical protein [Paenibacillus sp. cl141a]MBY0164234.1 hypothetical protein [Cytobacillus firmus]SEM54958.1 hypothetical protein SAMN04488688_114120 [Paenibacillus sp. cl141a]